MSQNTQQYILVELRSGLNLTGRHDRMEALVMAHELNKRYPKERFAICAV